jgi:carboxymethylenebutenolidase
MAAAGYYVLLPDLFYRSGPYTAPDPVKLFSDPAVRAEWSNMIGSATPALAMADTEAFLAFLAAQPEVKQPKIGVTGYCMGGRLAVTAAGTFPDRVAVAASFHGGRLANDAPDSPHLLAPKMKGRVYVAGAIEDPSFSEEEKARLEEALTKAGVKHTVVTYEGAKHGWVPSDTPVHNPAAAERHYQALFGVLKEALG